MLVWDRTPASEGRAILECGMVTLLWPKATVAQQAIRTTAIASDIREFFGCILRLTSGGEYKVRST
jgi:hypothetical protein